MNPIHEIDYGDNIPTRKRIASCLEKSAKEIIEKGYTTVRIDKTLHIVIGLKGVVDPGITIQTK